MSKALKLCPFCGGEAEYSKIDTSETVPFGTVQHFVTCKNNCLEGLYARGNTKEEATKAWNRRPSPWHTGTPTEDGMYICKVFYGDIQNDIRILEWVGAMDCFCLPNSDTRIYHFYVGENNGEEPEVVYEWLKLDLRFRMEQDIEWMDPIPIHLNSSIRGTLEDCLNAAKKQVTGKLPAS